MIGCGDSTGELTIELSPERVDRGRYLVTAVIECAGCHSKRDNTRYGFPPVAGEELAGGFKYNSIGSNAHSPNLTPYHLESWSDQQVFDALTRGVRSDGRRLHGFMPYRVYRAMDHEEVYSIIAYLRSLDSMPGGPYSFENETGLEYEAEGFAPGALPRPGNDSTAEVLGEYLVNIAGCDGCHRGPPDFTGKPFAGGSDFGYSAVDRLSANLTPHDSTGIGKWSNEQFVARFRSMNNAHLVEVGPTEPRSIMPWWVYGNMTDEDLSAVYAYLRTVEPVDNLVGDPR